MSTGKTYSTKYLLDSNNNRGAEGQVLSSTNSGIDWVTLSEISGVDGTGTANYLSKWLDANTITNSLVYDNGTNVGIGTTGPSRKLSVAGAIELTVADTAIHIGHAAIRRGASGEMFLDAPGNITVTIDTNLNNTDRVFNVRKDAGTELFRVQENGNVGIGTTNPSGELHVKNVAELYTSLAGSDSAINFVDGQGDVWRAGIRAADNSFRFCQSSTSLGTNPRVTIADGGNVGIGTTSPTSPLTIKSNSTSSSSSGLTIQSNSNTNNIFELAEKSTDGARLQMYDAGVAKIALYTDGTNNYINAGNFGIGTTSPSELLEVSSNTGAADGTTNPTTIRISDTDNGSAWDTANSFANLDFYSADSSGSGAGTKARVGAIAENSTGAQIGLAFSTTNSTDGISEKLRIDSSGNVGIGTTSPLDLLHIKSTSTDARMVLDGAVDAELKFFQSGTAKYAVGHDAASGNFVIGTTNVDTGQRLVINSSGNVGIGTTSATNILHTYTSSNTVGRFESSDSDAHIRINDNADSLYVGTQSQKGYIGSTSANSNSNLTIDLTNGNVGIGTASPNVRLELRREDSGDLFELNRPASGVSALYGGVSSNDPYLYSNNGIFSLGVNNPNGGLGGEVAYITMRNGSTRYTTFEAGNVGIGTTSPSSKLHVAGQIMIGPSSGTPSLKFQDSGVTNAYIDLTDGQQRFDFRDDSDTVMSVTLDTLRVGIGTTSPNALLHVSHATAPTFRLSRTGTGQIWQQSIDSSGRLLINEAASEGGTQYTRLAIDDDGNVGIGNPADSGGNGALDSLVTLRVGGTGATQSDAGQGTLQLRGYSAANNQRVGTIEFVDDRSGPDNIISRVSSSRDTAIGDGNLRFDIASSAGTLSEAMRIRSTGAIKFNTYGAGTFTGTVTQKLGVDSSGNVIEMPIGAGPVDGSGTANYLARWIDSDTLGIGAAYDNGTNVGIGTTNPAKKLHVLNSTNEAQIRLGQSGSGSYDLGVYANDTFSIGRDADTQEFNIKSGNVGIGTTSPSSKLHVGDGTADDFIKVFHSDNTNLDIHGYGIEFNRSVAYLRPTTNANKTLTVGTNTRNFNNIYFYASGSTTFHNANDELVRIDSAGNVGIGTTSPSTRLHISTPSSNSQLTLERTGSATGKYQIYTNTNNLYINNVASNTFPLTILNSGNVGIGTPSPSFSLDTRISRASGSFLSDGLVYALGLQNEDTTAGNAVAMTFGHGGYAYTNFISSVRTGTGANPKGDLAFGGRPSDGSGFVERMRITAEGNVGIGTTSPSYKLEVNGDVDINNGSLLVQQAYGINLGVSGYDIVMPTATRIAIKTSATERLTILNNGNVGIGTPSPRYQLDLATPSSTTQSDYIGLGVRNGPSGGGGSTLGSGIIWKANFASYTKRSAGIVQIAESNYFQSGLAFFTNGTADLSTDWVEAMRISKDGNVGIGTTAPCAKLEVNGHFAATSKSFIIDHPTKEDKKLQYASLEGPENGVYVRGTTDKETIELPEYWSELVHEDSITVVLTPIGKKQDLFIIEKSNKLIKIGGAEGSFDYVVYGERKDIDKLEIEPLKV